MTDWPTFPPHLFLQRTALIATGEDYSITNKHMTDTVHLRIMNPTQEPVELGPISKDLTIRGLKTTLQREYPGHPPVASQRLILSGKLLSDSERLGGLAADSDGVAEVSCLG